MAANLPETGLIVSQIAQTDSMVKGSSQSFRQQSSWVLMEDNYKVSVNDVHSPKHPVTSGIYSGRKNDLDMFGLFGQPLKCMNRIASYIKILKQVHWQTNDNRYILRTKFFFLMRFNQMLSR